MAKSTTGAAVDPELPPALQVTSPVERRRFRRLTLGIASLLTLLAGWEGLTWIIAYTDDAYVQSNLVAVAPQVAGVIVTVTVANNQDVRRGDLLAVIDKIPFELAVDERQAALQSAIADDHADQDEIATARAKLDAAAAALQYANQEQQRVANLIKDDTVSRQQFDQANDVPLRAQADHSVAQAAVDKAT